MGLANDQQHSEGSVAVFLLTFGLSPVSTVGSAAYRLHMRPCGLPFLIHHGRRSFRVEELQCKIRLPAYDQGHTACCQVIPGLWKTQMTRLVMILVLATNTAIHWISAWIYSKSARQEKKKARLSTCSTIVIDWFIGGWKYTGHVLLMFCRGGARMWSTVITWRFWTWMCAVSQIQEENRVKFLSGAQQIFFL